MPFGAPARKTASAEVPSEPEAEVTEVAPDPKPVRAKRKATSRGERAKRSSKLPVLVVDETVLLPHMSIPFPIDDDESAMVLDRALRMPSRHVLVLTERPVRKSSDEIPD